MLDHIIKITNQFYQLVCEAKKWKSLPKGWNSKSRKSYYNSIGGFDQCMKEMKGKIDDPGAFCSALKDRATGTTKWRKGKRKKK